MCTSPLRAYWVSGCMSPQRSLIRDPATCKAVDEGDLRLRHPQHGVRRIYSRAAGLRRYVDIEVVDPFASGPHGRAHPGGSNSVPLGLANLCRLGISAFWLGRSSIECPRMAAVTPPGLYAFKPSRKNLPQALFVLGNSRRPRTNDG